MLVINSVNQNSFKKELEMGVDFPKDINLDDDYGELKQQEIIARKLFPTIKIVPINNLIDRAGTKRDASYLVCEYQLAYGKDWVVWAGRRDADPSTDVRLAPRDAQGRRR